MLPAVRGPAGSRTVPVMTPPSGTASVSAPAPVLRMSPSTVPETAAWKSPGPSARTPTPEVASMRPVLPTTSCPPPAMCMSAPVPPIIAPFTVTLWARKFSSPSPALPT